MTLLFARYLGILLFLLAFLHGIGYYVSPFKSTPNLFLKVFFRIFLGLIICSSVFSVFKSGFLTVQMVFFLWLLFFYFEKQDSAALNTPSFKPLSRKSYIPGLIIAVLLVFSWAFIGRVNGGAFPFVLPSGTALSANDIHIYSLRSYYLAQSGWENYFGVYNTFASDFHGLNPYHYLELWFTGAITTVFGGLNILNLSLITGPIFQILGLLGILAIWERFATLKWYHPILATSFLLLAGLYLFYGKFGFPALSLPILTYRFKMVVYYPFFFAFLLSTLYQQKKSAILCLLALPIATIVALPAVLGTIVLFTLGNRFGKFFTGKDLKQILLYTLVLLGGLALFYGLTPVPNANSTFAVEGNELSSLLDPIQLFGTIPTYFKRFIYVISHTLLLYLPFLAVAILLGKRLKPFTFIGWISLFLLISAALAYSLLADFAQSSQLFYNPAFSLVNCIGILLFSSAFIIFSNTSKSSFQFRCTSVLFIITICSQFYLLSQRHIFPRNQEHYSASYLLQIQEWVKTDQLSSLGGAIRGASDYESEYSKMTAGYVLGYYLQFMKDGITTVSMSDFEVPIDPENERNNLKDISSGVFFQYVQKQKNKGSFRSIADSQVKFMQDNGINFLILTQNATLPSEFEEQIKQVLEDPVSGERFVLLNGS